MVFDENPKIWGVLLIPILIFGGLTVLGIRDLLQKSHAVLRNYPISAHIRFLLEEIRPEMRQYFFESEKDGMPFSRDTRAWSISAPRWCSTSGRSAPRRTSIARAMNGCTIRWRRRRMPARNFRVTIGGPDCAKPYSASVFNISAMSFGALSPNAVRALNAGAKKGGFAHDTGEGGVSPYHRENGGDIIWEIGSGYFGCRNRDGSFNPERSPRSPATTRSRWSSSRSARAPSPAMAACCRRQRSRRKFRRSAACAMGEDCISPASIAPFRRRWR